MPLVSSLKLKMYLVKSKKKFVEGMYCYRVSGKII